MAGLDSIKFPQGTIYLAKGKNGSIRIEYNKNYVNKFKTNGNRLQVFVDNKVITYLQEYVSFKKGVQAKSIRLSSEEGSGVVVINVPYASYQAYSPKIHKRVGKRGTYPFERMKSDKRNSILIDAAKYSRRING